MQPLLQINADMRCICMHRAEEAARCSSDDQVYQLDLYHVDTATACSGAAASRVAEVTKPTATAGGSRARGRQVLNQQRTSVQDTALMHDERRAVLGSKLDGRI